jgi:S-adenosylmethionine-diacylgycerolhomoserine-N-methlytransferase
MNHRHTMTRYYRIHSRIYDATRWMFLFGRSTLLEDLNIQRGETVLEIGCGTGTNLRAIAGTLQGTGRMIGVDCSAPMLHICKKRIARGGWVNAQLRDLEYGHRPVMTNGADVVIMSYVLSMIPAWKSAVACAYEELKPGGRIGVVDFCQPVKGRARRLFAKWLALNHVIIDRPYRETLACRFEPSLSVSKDEFGGLWTYYRFVGRKSR